MISLSSPKVLGKEKEYINECLQSGWISTSGPFIEKFENENFCLAFENVQFKIYLKKSEFNNCVN